MIGTRGSGSSAATSVPGTVQTVQPLGALLDAAPDAMLVVDGDGRISHMNAQAETLFGYSRGELLDRTMEVLLPERFRGAHPAHRQSYHGEPRTRLMGGASVELFGRRKDGGEFPAEVSLSPLPWEGRLLVIAAIRDVSARRKVEARFRRLMDAAPDALVLSNKGGQVVLVNEQAERLFGYGRGEMLSLPIAQLIPARPAHPANESGDPPVVQLYGRRKDGSEFPAEITLSPLDADADDEPIAIAAVRDISERLKAEAERAKLMQAQEAIRLRDEFLSVASHELRTPLTPIQLQIDGALRAARRNAEEDLPTVIRKLEALSNGIHRLSTLVNQLLDLSRITAGRLDLERTSLDLTNLVARAMAAFEDEAVRNECPLELEAPRSEVRGRWDTLRLEQIVTNLLSNALRYGGGHPVTLTIAEPRPGHALLLVRDQGIGIAPEHQALVFQRFERVSESRQDARHKGGFGLGLWIVRQIVEAHGGIIEVFSRPGLGATFAVELPTELPAPITTERIVVLVAGDAGIQRAFRSAADATNVRGLCAGHDADLEGLLRFGVRPALVLLDHAATPADLAGLRGVPVARFGACAAKPPSSGELQQIIAGHLSLSAPRAP